jgi:hypothetical protein
MRSAGLAAMLLLPALAAAQTPVDKTRLIVAGRVIMDTDIRVALELELVSRLATTDAAVQTELENRHLMLAEIGTTSIAEPTDAEVAERRQQWERSLGPGGSPAERLAAVHMTEADLTAWLKDDVRIQKYLRDRFVRETNVPDAVNRWIQDLRRRAGLR